MDHFELLMHFFSEIIHVLRSHNTRADKLAWSVRNQSSFSLTWIQNYQMDLKSPSGICLCC